MGEVRDPYGRKRTEKTGVSTVKGTGSTDTSATERAAVSSDLSSGKAAKGGGADMPKQEPGETPAAYGARLRKWREGRSSAANQAKALSGN